jgi:hypothetical protein
VIAKTKCRHATNALADEIADNWTGHVSYVKLKLNIIALHAATARQYVSSGHPILAKVNAGNAQVVSTASDLLYLFIILHCLISLLI